MWFNGEHGGGAGLTVEFDGVGFHPWGFYDSMEAEISLVFLR